MPDDDTPQADEQPADDQPAEQAEEQPAENDQPVDQAEEQPAEGEQASDQSSSKDQPTEQSQEQATDSDQTADQPPDISQSATPDSADDAVAPAGGGSSPAAGGGGGHKLKVIAEFTQEGGQKFMGEDIKIVVAEWDNGQQRRFLFPIDAPDRQSIFKNGNIITTPQLPVTTNEVIIYPEARVRLAQSMISYQNITGAFAFKVPGGTTLQTKFDVTVQPVDKTVKAANADEAKGMAAPPAKQYASFDLKAESVGNQQFHVTGKYYSGGLNSPDGRRI